MSMRILLHLGLIVLSVLGCFAGIFFAVFGLISGGATAALAGVLLAIGGFLGIHWFVGEIRDCFKLERRARLAAPRGEVPST